MWIWMTRAAAPARKIQRMHWKHSDNVCFIHCLVGLLVDSYFSDFSVLSQVLGGSVEELMKFKEDDEFYSHLERCEVCLISSRDGSHCFLSYAVGVGEKAANFYRKSVTYSQFYIHEFDAIWFVASDNGIILFTYFFSLSLIL
jgi:hypothetical protein